MQSLIQKKIFLHNDLPEKIESRGQSDRTPADTDSNHLKKFLETSIVND